MSRTHRNSNGKRKTAPVLLSLAANIVILLLVLHFTSMSYETNDDYAMALRIVDGEAYFGFVNYYLCRLLILVQHILPAWNAFVTVQIAVSFLAFTAVLRVLISNTSDKLLWLTGVLVIGIFSFDHYAVLQYTKTSALACAAGMLLITDCAVRKGKSVQYVEGVLFLFFGLGFRYYNVPVAVAFAGLYLLLWLIDRRKELIPEGYFRLGRNAGYLFVILALIGLGACFLSSEAKCEGTDALKQYSEYNDARSLVLDRPVYSGYAKHEAEYDAIGITKNDLYLVTHWYLDYNGAAGYDYLNQISAIYDSTASDAHTEPRALMKSFLKDVKEDLRSVNKSGIHIGLLMLLFLADLIARRAWRKLYPVMTGVLSVSLYLLLYYIGRPAYRALYVIDLCAALFLLYSLCRYREDGRGSLLQRSKKILVHVLEVVIIAGLLYGVMPEIRSAEAGYKSSAGKMMAGELESYLNAHPENYYVFRTGERQYTEDYRHPLRAPVGADNYTGFGGWGTMSPYLLSKYAERDLGNLFEDIIDREDVYVVDSKNIDKLEKYFNRWYGENGRIEMVHRDRVAGHDIWQAVRTET